MLSRRPASLQGWRPIWHNSPRRIGIATVALRLRDGMLDMDAHRGFPTPWASLTHFSGLSRTLPHSPFFNQYFLGGRDSTQPHEIDLCISHFLFVRRTLFDAIGPWDEDFFLYGEDVDFCYRTKAAGYKIMYLPQFTVTHYKGASVGVRKQSSEIADLLWPQPSCAPPNFPQKPCCFLSKTSPATLSVGGQFLDSNGDSSVGNSAPAPGQGTAVQAVAAQRCQKTLRYLTDSQSTV